MSNDGRLMTLMKRYQDGDGAVLAEIYGSIAPGLINYLYRRCGDRALAEDMLQEVFLRVHKVRHTYLPNRPVKPWVYAIARHASIDMLRKKGRRREVVLEEAAIDNAAARSAHEGGPAYGMDEIEMALESLPAAQREAMMLTKISGLSVRETSAVLGISEGAVKVKVHRAVKAVYRFLKSSENGTGVENEEA